MPRRTIGVLLPCLLLFPAGLQAQAAGSLRVDSVDELLANLELTAGATDMQVQSSTNAQQWTNIDLFVPAGRTFTFPLPKPGEERGFFRLASIDSEALEEAVPDLNGTILGAPGLQVYKFDADGTGFVALVQGRGDPTAFYDYAWSVDNAQPGMVTVRTVATDGYLEVLNIQFLAAGQIGASITSSEGTGGQVYRAFSFFQELTLGAELGTAPATLDSTSWKMVRESLPDMTATFAAGGNATGPNLLTGAMTTWTYSYIPTGSNTATLEVTDPDGNFGRFFLIFEQSGVVGTFGFSSGAVEGLFGENVTRGDFEKL